MRLFRRGRHAQGVPPPNHQPDPAAARARAESAARLTRAQREVVIPLRKMRDQNNVTQMARRLLAKQRGRSEPGTAH